MALFDWIGDIFKGEKEELPGSRMVEQPFQSEMRRLIQSYAGGGGEFRGEQKSLLEGYLKDEGLPGLAKTEAERTLGDYYEPYVGKYYEPYRKRAIGELEKAKTRLGRSAEIAGMYQTTPRLGLETEMEEATLSNLMTTLGGMHERERGRKTAMVPYAEQAPLRKMQAAQSFEEAPLQWAMNLLTGYRPELERPEYIYEPSLFEVGLGYSEQLSRILGNIIPGASPTPGPSKYAAEPSYYGGGGMPTGEELFGKRWYE